MASRMVLVLCGIFGLTLGSAGCSSSDNGDSAPPAVSASPSPVERAHSNAAEQAALLAAYHGMTEAEARSYATGKLDSRVENYAADQALSDIKETLFYYQQRGTVMRGAVSRSAKVTEIRTQSDPLKAVVTDCADSVTYNQVSTRTGKIVAYEGPRRHVVISTAARSKSGQWKFYTSVIERDRTC